MSKGITATVETQASIRAYLIEGYSSTQIAALTGIPDRTIRAWRSKMPDLAAEQEAAIAQRSVEIIRLADTAQEMGLQYLIDQGPEAAAKALVAINAIRGTHTDKLQRRGNPTGTQVNILIAQKAMQTEIDPNRYE